MTPPRQTDRAFGLMFGTVFAVIATVGFLVFDLVMVWVIVAAVIFWAVALIVPWLLLPLNRLWTVFGMRLGHINNYILLGAFFFIFVLPVGLIMRLFGDPLKRKAAPDAVSYWTPVTRKTNAETYRDMF